MNWPVFLLALWLLLGLELALKPALALGPTAIAPCLVLPLIIFVAMHAPAVAALWAALIAGLLLDLTFPIALTGGGEVRVPGPAALGLTLAATLVLNLRAMLIKRNPLTLLAMAVAGSLVWSVVVVALLSIRATYGDPIAWHAGAELATRLASSLYTGVAGLVEALILFPMATLFGFTSHHAGARRFTGR
jgi:cell shape-determining protein MreD